MLLTFFPPVPPAAPQLEAPPAPGAVALVPSPPLAPSAPAAPSADAAPVTPPAASTFTALSVSAPPEARSATVWPGDFPAAGLVPTTSRCDSTMPPSAAFRSNAGSPSAGAVICDWY